MLRGEQRLQWRSVWHPADLRVSTQEGDEGRTCDERGFSGDTRQFLGKALPLVLWAHLIPDSVATEARWRERQTRRWQRAQPCIRQDRDEKTGGETEWKDDEEEEDKGFGDGVDAD